MTAVNLDALILREDFDVKAQGGEAPTKPCIEIRELEKDQFFFGGLRKPDLRVALQKALCVERYPCRPARCVVLHIVGTKLAIEEF